MGSFVPNDHLNEPSEKNTHSTDHAEMLHQAVKDWMESPKPGASEATGTHSPDAAHILGNFHLTDGSAPSTSKSADAGVERDPKGGKLSTADKEFEKPAKSEDLGKSTALANDGAKGEDLAGLAKPDLLKWTASANVGAKGEDLAGLAKPEDLGRWNDGAGIKGEMPKMDDSGKWAAADGVMPATNDSGKWVAADGVMPATNDSGKWAAADGVMPVTNDSGKWVAADGGMPVTNDSGKWVAQAQPMVPYDRTGSR
jgi:hypothetical protein